MRILVTGGAGYIGSILVPALLDEGYRVVVLDSFLYRQASLLEHCHNPHLEIVRGDARDRAIVKPLVKQADVIFPLACLVGAPLCQQNPVGARTTNYEAIQLLLELRSREQFLVFPTTNSGYGIGESGVMCTEETPLQPISLYGKLKVEAEQAVLDSGNALTIRLATVFGMSPRMRLDLLVNDFTYRAVHDRFIVLFEAHFKRNFIHIRDVARTFIHCLKNHEAMSGTCYNVGLSDANLSKAELCEKIKAVLPSFYYIEAPIGEDPDKRDYIVSNKKLENTDFLPQISIESGIQELVKGYQVIKNHTYSNV